MEFKTENVRPCVRRLEESVNSLSNALKKREWDDSVKVSFDSFYKICNKTYEKINESSKNIERICNELNGLGVDNLVEQSSSLCEKTNQKKDSVDSAINKAEQNVDEANSLIMGD